MFYITLTDAKCAPCKLVILRLLRQFLIRWALEKTMREQQAKPIPKLRLNENTICLVDHLYVDFTSRSLTFREEFSVVFLMSWILASRASQIISPSFQVLADESNENRLQLTKAASESTEMKVEPGFDPLALGQQFCQWFFKLLNSQNPSLGQQPQEWGPQHFFPDVKLRLLSW